MKILQLIAVVLFMSVFIVACQKQDDFPTGKSVGSLKKSGTGDCLPLTVNGLFKKDSVLDNNSYADVQLDITTAGTFDIHTDTINGYSFSRTGGISKGLRTIRLYAKGKPVATGTNMFTVKYGTSVCTFSVVVGVGSGGGGGGGTPAVYTLGGDPGNCTGVVLAGTYMASIPTGASNTATVEVNVISIGSYSLSTTTANGVKFSASGNFTSTTNPQTVVLRANTATPPAQGPFDYIITGASTTCKFTVTYLPAPPPAMFTLSGAPGACTPATINGTYTAGTALTASNNVDIEVNVATTGAYTITTDLVNGMQFTKSGVFTTTGLQNVTLLATAGSNPVAGGTSTLTPLAGSSSCTFDIVVAAPSDLVYSFKIGATTYSGPCSGFLFNNGGGETMNIFDSGTSNGIDMDLVNPVGPVNTIGFYSGTSTSGKYAQFAYNTTQFVSFPGTGLTTLNATITSINMTTRIVQGTFTGTVVNLSLNVFTITNGVFKADF